MTGMGEGAIMPVKRIMNPGSGHLKLNIAWFSASQTLICAMQCLTELQYVAFQVIKESAEL